MIVNYSSESEGEDKINKKIKTGILVDPNPDTDISMMLQKHEVHQMELYKKEHPEEFEKPQTLKHLVGILRADQITDFNFNENCYNFQNKGFSYDPSDPTKLLVQKDRYPQHFKKIQSGHDINTNEADFIFEGTYGGFFKSDKQKTQELKQQREKFGKPNSDAFMGPWAKYKVDEGKQAITEQEMKDNLQKIEVKKQEKMDEQKKLEEYQVTCEFHGGYTLANNSITGKKKTLPAPIIKGVDPVCYIPKKVIHIYSGHTKGVQKAIFYPKFGHLILSASLDTTLKLWSTGEVKELLRTYKGHTEAVRDVCFSWDGKQFVSASYDKVVHHWDTEYGKVINSYKLKTYPYVVKFHYQPQHSNVFLIGTSGKKIAQYDTRTGTRTLVYDEHLAPVNTITFCENGRKFASSSDDKKIFVWEFGIPVCIRHIQEPDQHATNAAALHPSGNYFAAQMNNNIIQVYDAKSGSFRKNQKKKFLGHRTGFSVGICFSHDGQFIASGDAEGRAFFWDWKSMKTYRVFEAHDQVCNGVEWHPSEASKVITFGNDGLIKYYD